MIEIANLNKTFKIGFWMKSVQALKNVHLNVEPGALYGFVGPNGAGKSTTIKILLGLLRYSDAKVQLMGKPASDYRARLEVGYLPEQSYFYDYLTGYELLNFYGHLHHLSGAELQKRIDEAAELVNAKPDWLKRNLRTYSKGMLQRVGIAQALLSKPKLAILDEPMSGLDPMGRREIRNLLKYLHAQGTTIFYSSHVLSDVEAICTGVAMIVKGEIRRQGSVDDVLGKEEISHQIHFQNPVNEFPLELGKVFDTKIIICATDLQKMQTLQWAINNKLDITAVDKIRPTLEDALAEEVAKD